MIPIFDSLSHPTISNHWLKTDLNSSFHGLNNSLSASGFIGAAAVGIHGIGDYEHEAFIHHCDKYDLLYPVAGFDLNTDNIKKEMSVIKELGYSAIKLHPRFNKFNLKQNERLSEIFKHAYQLDLVVFFCSYMHTEIISYPSFDPFYQLIKILKKSPNLKLVIVHGGDVNLLKYAELVRFNDNLLLDLSMTMLKYKGSSIDNDIKFLFRNFDRRICIGTDHPEYSHENLRTYFDSLIENLESYRAENIGYKNIMKFLKLNEN